MSLINDMLQDLEARDAPAPAHSVPRPRRARAFNWLPAVLGALALAAAALLAIWLLRDVAGAAPDHESLATVGAVSDRDQTPTQTESSTDSAPTAQATPSTGTAPDHEPLATVGAVSDRDQTPTQTESPTDSAPAAQATPSTGTAPDHDPLAAVGAVSNRDQTPTQTESPTDSAPATETMQPVGAVSDRDQTLTENPSPTDSAPPTQQSNTAIVVRPAGRTRDAAAEGLDSARRALARGQTGVAISRLEQLLDQHPDASEVRILMARTLLATDRSQRAELVLSEGLARDSSNHDLAFWLARSQLQQNRAGPALATLQRHAPAVEAAPGYHLLLAATLRQLGRHEDAFEHYRTITTASPENTRAWLGRALSAEALGRTDAARDAYSRVLEGGEAEASRLARQRLNALGPDAPRN